MESLHEVNGSPHEKMPNIENNCDVGEDTSYGILDMAAVIHHCHLGFGNSKKGKSTLEACQHLLYLCVELSMAESLQEHFW